MENVVDLLIQVAADALGLDIYIYQKNDENVQVLKYSGGPLCKPVHVFTHNNIHSQGNHYDAILKEIKEDSDCNLHLLSDVALQQQLPTAHKHNLKHMTSENNQVFNSYVKTKQCYQFYRQLTLTSLLEETIPIPKPSMGL